MRSTEKNTDLGVRTGRWLPLRGYLHVLLLLFAVTAAVTVVALRQIDDPAAVVVIALFAMGVLLLGTLGLYRSLMRPLIQLSERMGQGTSGLVRGPIAPSGPAEIARLALRFNALIAAVQAEIRETGLAEELAHVSERNYRLLFDGNPQPLFVYDVDTLAILEVNACACSTYGYTRDEFRALSLRDIVTTDRAAALVSVAEPSAHRSKNGTIIEVELTSIRLRYDGHDARLVVVDDLTERRKLEHQLQQSQRLETVGQLAGGIAHDFNNLLAVILNYAEFVADELPDGNLKQDVEEIQRAATRAADLTRQLLIFARRETTDPQLLDLNAVIAGVETMLRRTLGENVELRLTLEEQLFSVRADHGQIEQVVLNLAVNARDAMPAGGQLVVETATVELGDDYAAAHPGASLGRYVRLSVSDNGMGMSPEVLARAFEPFFTTKDAGQGTGLGLATVYGIVTQAGGSVSISSEPRLGTRVSIHLPAIAQPAATNTRREQTLVTNGDGRFVLVVEDDSAVLAAVIRILGGHGYRVLARGDPANAIKVLIDPDEQVDLLLTDVMMPRMSGVELARSATALRPDLPILYMTGYSQELIAQRGALPLGSHVVQKPFTGSHLLEAVAQAIAGCQQ